MPLSGEVSSRVGDRLSLLSDVAKAAGPALENGRLYDQERENARLLQRGLLAGEPPHDPRIAIVTHYRSGVDDTEVGGDWYDSFPIRTDRIAVVVGDVVGRGIVAASAMGQVRSAIRALASAGTGPASLLERLDRYVDRFEAGRMATVAYAELDLVTGRLRYACAGHPPPLLVEPDGTTRYLWGGRSAPLASFAGVTQRGEDVTTLRPGSRLLLYTDGLIERRDASLDQTMDRLARIVGDRHQAPFNGLLGGLVTELVADRHTDDVCLLGMQYGAEGEFVRTVRADVMELAPLRADLRGWLARLPNADDRNAWLLACSEAVANAIEHGYRGEGSGLVAVRARVVDGALELTVQDWGRWREPMHTSERGRGLVLLRRLMDTVDVIREAAGTRVFMRRRLATLGEAVA